MESLIFLFFGNSAFTVQSWLAWYFLCRPGWSKPETSLSLPLIAGFKGMCYYVWLNRTNFVSVGSHSKTGSF